MVVLLRGVLCSELASFSHLATTKQLSNADQGLFSFLRNRTDANTDFWLGGQRSNGGAWQWIDGTNAANLNCGQNCSLYNNGAPSGSGSSCIERWHSGGNGLGDDDCSIAKPFVCEIDLVVAPKAVATMRPWPQYLGGPNHTGRSLYVGAPLSSPSSILYSGLTSSGPGFAIGSDNTLYFGMRDNKLVRMSTS